ncbi:MAG: PorT family protein [Bacteroides sp.]|nr:PorT family protein [Bacteroides sp.]MCM1414109.1 PorT family protein [Bacteroides sp.]MCM1472373.1 PorT family protein [Bacteroides sp.]
MKISKAIYAFFVMLSLALSPKAMADDFVDFSPAKRMLEVDVHALGGVGSVIQNYKSHFPQIQNLNVNLGESLGLGFRAVYGIREYLGFGTAIDLTMNKYNIDMAILGSDNMSMSAVFIDNRMYYVNIPVFASFRFNIDKSVRWSVDVGMYYAYGIGGTQKQRIYRADVNAMDELVPQVVDVKTDYFHSSSTLINGFNRGDLGVHLATFVNFGPHLIVGARYQIGCKNASRSLGVVNPSIHNHYFQGIVGYRF